MDIFQYFNSNPYICFNCKKFNANPEIKDSNGYLTYHYLCRNCEYAVRFYTNYSKSPTYYDNDRNVGGYYISAQIFNNVHGDHWKGYSGTLVYLYEETMSQKVIPAKDTSGKYKNEYQDVYVVKNYITIMEDDGYYRKKIKEKIEVKEILQFPNELENILNNYKVFK